LLLKRKLQRAPHARVIEHRAQLVALADDGRVMAFPEGSAALVAFLLDELVAPKSEEALSARAERQLGTPRDTVRAALAHLRAAGLVRDALAPKPKAKAPSGRAPRIALALCGGVVAAHAPALVELLAGQGAAVRIAATPSALRFVSKVALEAMTHTEVVTRGDALASWSDLVVVYPATAATISRIAHHDASSVASATALRAKRVLVVPAMNESMIRAPAVQRNLARLKKDGYYVALSALGYEVADAPGKRTLAFGAAPPVQVLVELVRTLIEISRAARLESVSPSAPRRRR
jgi:hypothetical protein